MLPLSPMPDDSLSSGSPNHPSDAAAQYGEISAVSNIANNPSSDLAVVAWERPGGARVLVVEDDNWLRDLVHRALLKKNYLVTTVSNAEAALETLHHVSCDLVLSDLRLSGMDGLELTQELVNRYPSLPVVLITGQNNVETMRAAIRAGACDFIGKPFSVETIPMVVERNIALQAEAQRNQLEEAEETAVRTAVKAFAAVIETKEPMTARHSRRVACLADDIGVALGLSLTDRRDLHLAAQLHDVGKIQTPEEILCKAGPLTDDEWEIIRLHPIHGAELLVRMDELAHVADSVRHHHEWISGEGYPDRLAGDRIPLHSRIIAVADAFEVMTAPRPYRPSPFSEGDALLRLQQRAGVQFDAAIVAAFVGSRLSETAK